MKAYDFKEDITGILRNEVGSCSAFANQSFSSHDFLSILARSMDRTHIRNVRAHLEILWLKSNEKHRHLMTYQPIRIGEAKFSYNSESFPAPGRSLPT